MSKIQILEDSKKSLAPLKEDTNFLRNLSGVFKIKLAPDSGEENYADPDQPGCSKFVEVHRKVLNNISNFPTNNGHVLPPTKHPANAVDSAPVVYGKVLPLEDRIEVENEVEVVATTNECSNPHSMLLAILKSHRTSENILETTQHQTVDALRSERGHSILWLDYDVDTLVYLRKRERKLHPMPNYMEVQPEITHTHRSALIDYLVDISVEFQLYTETLQLAVCYIDRYLSKMQIQRTELQLVGITALHIASKYEETNAPPILHFSQATEMSCTIQDITVLEESMLAQLGYDVSNVTMYTFCDAYAVFGNLPRQARLLGQYISELTILEGEVYLKYAPSLIAAAAIALANYTLQMEIWPNILTNLTTYRLQDMKMVFLLLNYTHNNARFGPFKTVLRKYRSAQYNNVANIVPMIINEEIFDELVRISYKQNEEQ